MGIYAQKYNSYVLHSYRFEQRTQEATQLKIELDKAQETITAAETLVGKLDGEFKRWSGQVNFLFYNSFNVKQDYMCLRLYVSRLYVSRLNKNKEPCTDNNKRGVLRRQSRDSNLNIKRLVYCRYG